MAEDRVDAGPVAAVTDNEVTVNGALRSLDGVPVHTNALDWLRSCGLTGSKEGCAEGECGACAMLIATPAADAAGAAWTAVNSCLVPAQALRGQEIVTAEGLGTPEELHPVQEAMAVGGGSQCGYCTPGFVCSMAGEYYRRDRAPIGDERTLAGDERTLAGGEGTLAGGEGTLAGGEGTLAGVGGNGFDLHALSGNLCRCTGYRPIRDAAYELGMPEGDDPLAARLRYPAPEPVATDVTVDGARFVRPATLDEAVALLASEPEARLVAGATDWGVDVNLRGLRAPLVVAIDRLSELRAFRIDDDAEIEIGAALTLTEIAAALGDRVPLLSELLPQFASPLIRNRATLGGNLGTGSPIGDALPALLALGASVALAARDGERDVPLEEYFTGYRQTVRRDDEIIRALRFPAPRGELAAFHKIAKRRFDDISSVAVAFVLDLRGGVVADARIGLGGVAATPVRARATEQALIGRDWNLATVREVAPVLGAEGTPMSDHRASAAYRAAMLENALRKLFARHPKPTAEAVAR